MRANGSNFYSNERQLHGSSPDPATAAPCAEFFNVIMLRDPLEHVKSLLLNAYVDILGYIQERLQQPWMEGFRIPAGLDTWLRMAPAVVNNYYTRTLLGK
jgi:hypothetical protein